MLCQISAKMTLNERVFTEGAREQNHYKFLSFVISVCNILPELAAWIGLGRSARNAGFRDLRWQWDPYPKAFLFCAFYLCLRASACVCVRLVARGGAYAWVRSYVYIIHFECVLRNILWCYELREICPKNSLNYSFSNFSYLCDKLRGTKKCWHVSWPGGCLKYFRWNLNWIIELHKKWNHPKSAIFHIQNWHIVLMNFCIKLSFSSMDNYVDSTTSFIVQLEYAHC